MARSGPETNHLSWDDLRTALFLGRAGSIRGAARALGVSHSTVLRRLHALERAVGVRLFVDKGDGYEATPAGQDVFDTACTLEDAVTGLERRVSGHDHRLTGPVRVTLPDLFAPVLAPIFAEFSRTQPNIEVTLVLGTEFVDLAHRAADVAIRVAESPPPDLVGQRVCTVATGIYGAASYLHRRSTRDLEALDWIGWDAGSDMAFPRWMRSHVPDARIAVRVSAGQGLRDAVDAGAGVALVPCALGERMPGWRRVVVVEDLSGPLWVLTHRDLRTTTRVRVLRDFVVAAMRKERAWIEGRTRAPRGTSGAKERR